MSTRGKHRTLAQETNQRTIQAIATAAATMAAGDAGDWEQANALAWQLVEQVVQLFSLTTEQVVTPRKPVRLATVRRAKSAK